MRENLDPCWICVMGLWWGRHCNRSISVSEQHFSQKHFVLNMMFLWTMWPLITQCPLGDTWSVSSGGWTVRASLSPEYWYSWHLGFPHWGARDPALGSKTEGPLHPPHPLPHQCATKVKERDPQVRRHSPVVQTLESCHHQGGAAPGRGRCSLLWWWLKSYIQREYWGIKENLSSLFSFTTEQSRRQLSHTPSVP